MRPLFSLFSGLMWLLLCVAANFAHADYYQSWQNLALQKQNKLDINLPLGQASFLYTHNSFNSSAYANLGSYWDPNHVLPLVGQLDMGVRAIELDIHWTATDSGNQQIQLCHGTNDHTGCSIFDRRFADGIKEVNSWLRQNQNRQEVVMIYLEDHLDGHYDEAINIMQQYFAELVYKPAGCQGIPHNISKADILAAGKQVLLIGGNCATSNWSNYVFNGVWPTKNGSFSGYPTCTVDGMSAEQIKNTLVRIYEDSTNLTEWFGDHNQTIRAQVMNDAVKCGLGIVGAEPLTEYDSRMAAAIWSWAEGEPNNYNGNENCAVLNAEGRFNDVNCENANAFACFDKNNTDWRISQQKSAWINGEPICQAEFGSTYHFAVPRRAPENLDLIERRALSGRAGESVYLNYDDQEQEGNWLPNDYPALNPQANPVVWRKLLNDKGKCLDLEGRKTNNGNEIHQWSCHGADSQLWWQDNQGRIHNKMAPQKCVDASGAGTREGTRIVLWDCHDGANQKWLRGALNSFRIGNAPGMALDIKDPFWGDGQPAHLWTFHGGKSQRWAWD
jgi:hypothetical protein